MSNKSNSKSNDKSNGKSNGNNKATTAAASTAKGPDFDFASDPWHHGGTTDKVATQTGAAKDESFTVNNAASIILDVLANDPGSSRLWSIDQDALAGPKHVNVERDLEEVILPSGARLTVNADGTLSYTPPASIAELPEGQTFSDSFTYVIRMAKGALSSAQTTITIKGTHEVEVENTPATILGDLAASVDEDGATLTVGGTLQVIDPDAGEAAFAAVGDLNGSYGTFSFNLDSGEWSYVLDNNKVAVQQLNTGESLFDTLQVESVDGTTATITVTINGRDEGGDGAIAERWVLSATSLVRNTDNAQARIVDVGTDKILVIGGELVILPEGPGFVAIPDAPLFGFEDKLVYADMDYFPPVSYDIDNNGIDDSTALNFYYNQTVDGVSTTFNLLVVLIGFVGFDPDLHLSGTKDGVPI